ncbi:MAG: gliding motility-associated C-terminal domain-containing protein [Saprospiraceae bacterium]
MADILSNTTGDRQIIFNFRLEKHTIEQAFGTTMCIRNLRIFAPFFFLSALPTTSHAGCTDSVHVTVNPVQCHGLRNGVIEVTEIFGGTDPYYFSLDGQTYSTRPVFDFLWAGNYVLHVRDSTGCVRRYPVTVTQPEELQVALNAGDTNNLTSGDWLQLTASVHPPGTVVTSISWRPPALFTSQFQLNQTVRVLEDTDFAVEIQNANGCIARANLSVKVKKTNLYFPNVFSPASQQNNYFTLFSDDGVARITLLQIYDRSGALVFEKRNFLPNDPLQGWNGKWNGRLAPSGVYPWVGSVEFQDGKRKRFTGSITVIAQ